MSEPAPVRKVVVLGGGTAGWITAAMLVREFGAALDIQLVESRALGTIGVGEATVPTIKTLNNGLGLDEKAFIGRVNATFKLGIQFEGWGAEDSCYMHTFGAIGQDRPFCPFHHFFLRARAEGGGGDLWDYSLNYQAAKQGRFAPMRPHPELPRFDYAYHFDAALYAELLRDYSLERGVRTLDALVKDVALDPETGFVRHLVLDSGDTVEGDLFIDCSGFRALLIEKALEVGYTDWDHWLPCDRAIAAQTPLAGEPRPYTRSIAKAGGWQWQIPLQHRMGNGLVYSSGTWDEDEATRVFTEGLEGEPTTKLNHICFRVGVRQKPWCRNVVAIGLSGGFLEPLESTSIHLVHTAVLRLIWCFPFQGVSDWEIGEFNRQTLHEWGQVRDFIIAHYHLNTRQDSELWRHCASMDLPDSLVHKIGLYRETGKILRECEELFGNPSWLQLFEGQGLRPRQFHPIAAALSPEELAGMLDGIRSTIAKPLAAMPSHGDFLRMLASPG